MEGGRRSRRGWIHHRGAEDTKFGTDLSFVTARLTRRANPALFALVSFTLVTRPVVASYQQLPNGGSITEPRAGTRTLSKPRDIRD